LLVKLIIFFLTVPLIGDEPLLAIRSFSQIWLCNKNINLNL